MRRKVDKRLRQRRVVSSAVAVIAVALLAGCAALVVNFDVSLSPETQTVSQ